MSETKGGIEVYSFQAVQGYGIGVLPEGEFKVEMVLNERDEDNKEIKEWCREKLLYSKSIGLIPEFLSEKYIKVDNYNSYLIDYSILGSSRISARQICVEKNNVKFRIIGHPLNSDYLDIFNQILSTFKFIEK